MRLYRITEERLIRYTWEILAEDEEGAITQRDAAPLCQTEVLRRGALEIRELDEHGPLPRE